MSVGAAVGVEGLPGVAESPSEVDQAWLASQCRLLAGGLRSSSQAFPRAS